MATVARVRCQSTGSVPVSGCRHTPPSSSWWVIAATTSVAVSGIRSAKRSTRWARRTSVLAEMVLARQPSRPPSETKWLVRTSTPSVGASSPGPPGKSSIETAPSRSSTTVSEVDADVGAEAIATASSTEPASSRIARLSRCTGWPISPVATAPAS